jgi:hypothetical protein
VNKWSECYQSVQYRLMVSIIAAHRTQIELNHLMFTSHSQHRRRKILAQCTPGLRSASFFSKASDSSDSFVRELMRFTALQQVDSRHERTARFVGSDKLMLINSSAKSNH